MSVYKKVMITGCAKTGTTLLWQLCYAFDDVYIYDEDSESSLGAFFRYKYKGDKTYVVAKRNSRTIFSNQTRGKFNVKQQYRDIKKNHISIINIIRDGRDVLVSGAKSSVSSDRYVAPMRWLASMEHRRKYRDVIDVEVKYEELVSRVDEVQQKIADAMGWKCEYKFSEFPDFVPEKAFKYSNNRTKPRITRLLVGKDKKAYKKICPSHLLSRFEEELRLANYI